MEPHYLLRGRSGRSACAHCVSPNQSEAEDYAVVLFDGNGNSLAQSTTSAPSFIGTLPKTIRHFQAAIKDEGWHPGDVVITNDPWIGSGHLQDISMVAPIFSCGAARRIQRRLRTRLIRAAGGQGEPRDLRGRLAVADLQAHAAR